MMGAIECQDNAQRIMDSDLYGHMSGTDQSIMNDWLSKSTTLWVGIIKDKVVCCWGVVAPSLLSTKAYLWLYTHEIAEDDKFMFVRYSQRALEEVFLLYDCIYGHTKASEEQSIHWLKWLGAEFSTNDNGMLSFEIRKKQRG